MTFIEHSMPTIGRDEQKAVAAVLRTKFLAEGRFAGAFEDAVAEYTGCRGTVATSTGTLALHLALLALGVGRGAEVLLPSYVCRSLLNAVAYCGAVPVVCDVNEHDFNLSFSQAKKKLTRKTKAIIVAHMFGCPAEIDRFKALGVPVIEDCAHAIGAKYKGRMLGSWGDLAVFSFQGTKYIVAGEGGMVAANAPLLLKRLKQLKEPDGQDLSVKYTYRMTDLQAAIGMAQLAQLKTFIRKRAAIARDYREAFSGLNIDLPWSALAGEHIFHRFMIRVKGDSASFMRRCLARGVKVKQPVKPLALHQYLGLSSKAFPVTEMIMRSALSVPIYPSLNKDQVRRIIAAVSYAAG